MKLFPFLLVVSGLLSQVVLSSHVTAQNAFILRVEEAAKANKWKLEVDPLKRWMLVSGANTESTDRVIRGLQFAFGKLDELLGAPQTAEESAWARPAVLFYVPQKNARQAVVDVIAPADLEGGAEWRAWARKQTMFCYPDQGYAFQKQSANADSYGRYLVTAAIHTEFSRRYGAYPYWAAEAVNMSLQQVSGGSVQSFLAIDLGREVEVSSKMAKGWPKMAADVSKEDVFGVLWQQGGENPTPEIIAPWFAVGFWAYLNAPRDLKSYFELYARKAASGLSMSDEFNADLARACFGPKAQSRMQEFWKAGAMIGASEGVLAMQATSDLAAFAELSGLKKLESDDHQWRMYVEEKDPARDWIGPYQKQLKWVIPILPETEELIPGIAFVLHDRDSFRATCDVTAKAAPVSAGYIKNARNSSGFTNLLPPLVGCWVQKVADGWDPTHEIARQMMEVKLYQHCGTLPRSMSIGLTTAMQELACGGVKAHRLNINATLISSDIWKPTAARLVAAGKFSVEKHLFAVPPTEFDRDHEILCYAFGKFMLEAKPKQSQKFLKGYLAQLKREGSVAMTLPALEAMLDQHYGKNWPQDLQKYWAQ